MSRHLWEGGEVMLTRVAEVMSTTVITVPAGTGVVEAANPMVGRDKGALPIVDGERVVGIVTDRDIIADVVARGRDVTTMTVDEIGTSSVITSLPTPASKRRSRRGHVATSTGWWLLPASRSSASSPRPISAPTTTTMTSFAWSGPSFAWSGPSSRSDQLFVVT
jgi:hypothetical protein